jgi:hypothetical protein
MKKNISMTCLLVVGLLTILSAGNAFAGADLVRVSQIAIQPGLGVAIATDTAFTNSVGLGCAGCTAASCHWVQFKLNSEEGKAMYSAALAALLSNKPVWVTASTCDTTWWKNPIVDRIDITK